MKTHKDIRHLLIIDDSLEDREGIRWLLSNSPRHFRFSEASTGAAGVRACLEGVEDPPDCILLDYHLPDDDAPQVLVELGGPDRLRYPVVVVTGLAAGLDGPALLRLGAQDFISKEWMNPESLSRCIENAVERFWMSRALREREVLLGLLIEHAPAALAMLDRDLRYVAVNPAYAALYDTTPEALRGRSVLEVLQPEIQVQLLPHLRAALAGETRRLTMQGKDPGGWMRWVETTLRPLMEEGEVRGVVGSLHDLTEVRLAQTVQSGLGADAEHLLTLPGFDLGELLLVLGDPDEVQVLLHEFAKAVRDDADAITQAVSAGEVEEAGRIAHRLKGTAGSVGAIELLTATARLESDLQSGRDPAQSLVQLREIHGQTLTRIAALPQPFALVPSVVCDASAVRRRARVIQERLTAGLIVPDDILSALREALPASDQGLYLELKHHLERYDYRAASGCLTPLLGDGPAIEVEPYDR